MCGIGAIAVLSEPKPPILRMLASNLLRELRIRGFRASGIAVFYEDGRVWLRKAPIDPTLFAEKIKQIRFDDSRVVGGSVKYILLHARMPTTCPETINSCNHPLYIKRDGEIIALVHNGQMWDTPSKDLPPVDSAVLLEPMMEKGLNRESVREAMMKKGTYAAIWSDGRSMYYARNINPLCSARVRIGKGEVMILASTCNIIYNVLYGTTNKFKFIEPPREIEECTMNIILPDGGMELLRVDECKGFSGKWLYGSVFEALFEKY